MQKSISKKSGLAALALGLMTIAGATAASTSSAQAGWHGGGGWGHGGGWHHGGYRGGGWGHGPRWGFYSRPYAVREVYGCYRTWRTVWVRGEGYVRTRVRVCD